MTILSGNMTQFQNGGIIGKEVVDNLFIVRGIINHATYLNKELWLTFYDIEKCFDSLWLEDCINSLWENGVRDDMLLIIYMMNRHAQITIKTPFGDTDQIVCKNLVKQGTCLGPILNNCSLDTFCKESNDYQYGRVKIKSLEFVDDLADPNSDKNFAYESNLIIHNVQKEKRIKFSSEKCELLKINSVDDKENIIINDTPIKQVHVSKYLGDHFNAKGNNIDMCKERTTKAKGSTIELISLCKEVNFGERQLETMLLLYHAVFVPRLIYNCEAWSNVTSNDIKMLQNAQLSYMRRVMEAPRGTPIAAMYLELGILPIRYEIEIRQLSFLKRILDKEPHDPVLMVYNEMLTFENKPNWANNVFGLRQYYHLPINDANVKNMTKRTWKTLVKNTVRREAFLCLTQECRDNRKTSHLTYEKLGTAKYMVSLKPHLARTYFRVRLKMFDIKCNFKKKYSFNLSCPFCKSHDEDFKHIVTCEEGMKFPARLNIRNLLEASQKLHPKQVKKLATFFYRYQEIRKEII